MAHIEGLLVSNTPEGVRLVVCHSVLALDADAVVGVEPLTVAGLSSGLQPVRVEYRSGASGRGAGQLANGLLPFALAVRSEPVHVYDSPEYAKAAASFLAERGLDDLGEPSPHGARP